LAERLTAPCSAPSGRNPASTTRGRRAGPREPRSDAVTHLHQPHRRSQARSCPAADLAVRRHAHRHAPAAGRHALAPRPARHGVVVAPRAARPALRRCADRAGEKRPRQGLSAGSSRAGAPLVEADGGVRPPPYCGACPPRRDSCPASAPPAPGEGAHVILSPDGGSSTSGAPAGLPAPAPHRRVRRERSSPVYMSAWARGGRLDAQAVRTPAEATRHAQGGVRCTTRRVARHRAQRRAPSFTRSSFRRAEPLRAGSAV
jgi:hypothetical protein